MAQIVSLVGATHLPFRQRRTAVPENELTDDGRDLLAWADRAQESFARTNPDVVDLRAADEARERRVPVPQHGVVHADSDQVTFSR